MFLLQLGIFILDAVKESGGFAISVTDEHITKICEHVGQTDGLLLSPEGAATFAAYEISLKKGLIEKNDKVILFNTATGLKYPLPEVTKNLVKEDDFDISKFN